MGPLDVMKGQPVCDEAGWVDVNKNTLQHNRYSEWLLRGHKWSLPLEELSNVGF